MKISLSVLSAVALVAAVAASPAVAHDGDNGNHYGWANGNNGNHNGWENGNNGHRVHGAPGPIAGAAGLPVLAVGYGVYWLVRRRRKAASAAE